MTSTVICKHCHAKVQINGNWHTGEYQRSFQQCPKCEKTQCLKYESLEDNG